MNSGGDLSSKTASIEIKSYKENLNWFMRIKLIYRLSVSSESSMSVRYDYDKSRDG
jgi:hypothetical protein